VLATSYASGGKYSIVGKENKMYCVLQFGTKFYHEQTQGDRAHGDKYLSPTDVEEFRMVVLEAGTRLASLLTVEYPSADLVSDALYDVTDVVECYSLRGKWVTSWVSSARSEFLATSGIRGVSRSVTFLI